MSNVRFAVLASGRGSNLEAILAAIRGGALAADPVAVLSDRAEAPALELARHAGIATRLVPAPAGNELSLSLEERRRLHDGRVLDALAEFRPAFVVMAGYMRVVSARLLDAYRGPRGYARVVNVHPSLLPAFPGMDSYARAFGHGAKVTGVTVHLVEEQVDDGPICAQEAFSIADCRSPDEVERRGLELEHRLFPAALSWILPERFEVHPGSAAQRRLCVRPS